MIEAVTLSFLYDLLLITTANLGPLPSRLRFSFDVKIRTMHEIFLSEAAQ